MLYIKGTASLYYGLCAVGMMLSNALVNAGLITFQKLADTNPREIELVRSASLQNYDHFFIIIFLLYLRIEGSEWIFVSTSLCFRLFL